MKRLTPFTLVLIGSMMVSAVLFIILFVLELLSKIDYTTLFLVIFGGTLATFIIFYSLFKRFIHNRLKMLYRTIRTEKNVNQEKIRISMTKDLIGIAEKESQQWMNQRSQEISDLKEQEKYRREFLGNLAHELKTPTFLIQGYVHTLLDGGIDDPHVNRSFLERAALAIDRMTHMLDDLDNLTKFESNNLKLDIRPFELKTLCKEVFDSLELKAREKNIQLRFAKEYHRDFMVKADRTKIAQVFTNLIANSIFYGNKNGETVVRFYEVDDIFTVEISDNGPGIEPTEIPRLFERFYRVEKSRNRNEGGTGLGLSIVKHIMSAHNQTISVRSTVGVGSTFTFSLDKFDGTASSLVTSRGIKVK